MKRFILLNPISYLININYFSNFFFILSKKANKTLNQHISVFNDLTNNIEKLSILIKKFKQKFDYYFILISNFVRGLILGGVSFYGFQKREISG